MENVNVTPENYAPFDITDFDVELLYTTQATIIVSCAQNLSLAVNINRLLEAKHFRDKTFRRIWQIIATKLEGSRGNDLNLTTMQLELQRREIDLDLTKFMDLIVDDEDVIASYARKIKEISLRDKIKNQVQGMHVEEMDIVDVLEGMKNVILDVENDLTDVSLSKTLPEMLTDLEAYLESDEEAVVYRTGLPEADEHLVDLSPGNMAIIAASPGAGKTSLGVFMAIKNAWMGTPTHFISLEMSERQIIARFLNSITGVSATKMIKKKLTPVELKTIKDARQILEKLPIRISPYVDMPLNVLLQSMRESKARYGTEMFFVDYVQLIRYDGRTKREEASFVAQQLKSISLELDASVVVMSQLSRNNKVEPDMQDLKETSDLEQAASLIVLLYGDKLGITDHLRTSDSYPVFMKVAKQRNGETFRKLLDFMPTKMQFKVNAYDMDEYEEQRSKMWKKNEEQ